MNFELLEEKISGLDTKVSELTFMRKENLNRQVFLEKEINKLDGNIQVLDKVSSLFKHLLDVMLEKKKKDIEKLITYGLKTVVDNQDLRFHVDIEPKYNTISTSFRTEKVGVVDGDVLDNFGGGVAEVESFLLRVITLFQTKLSPFLFMDESFSHLSAEYVENCSLLLHLICERLGLTIFLITHQEMMLSHADCVYMGSLKNNKLVLEKKSDGYKKNKE